MEFIYTKERVSALLDGLQADTPPLWGTMSAQHMLEHLAAIYRMVDGRMAVTQLVPEDKVEKVQNRLRDPEWEMPVDFKAAFVGEGLPPLVCADLAAAQQKLMDEMDQMEAFFKAHPTHTAIHPYFGRLDYELWVTVHNKHFYHHFKQFGLVPR